MAADHLKIDTAFATLPHPGQSESGDLCLIKRMGKGTLLAVVDGLGHGQEAAAAAHAATMTWLGVGNVGGLLLRADLGNRPSRITLVPNAGFIGAEPAHPTARSVALALGDTVILFSDGIKDGFAESLRLSNTPQQIADDVITRHVKGNDDALVLVARYAR